MFLPTRSGRLGPVLIGELEHVDVHVLHRAEQAYFLVGNLVEVVEELC